MIQGNDRYIFNCSSNVTHGRAEHKALGKNDFKEGWNKILHVILGKEEFHTGAQTWIWYENHTAYSL